MSAETVSFQGGAVGRVRVHRWGVENDRAGNVKVIVRSGRTFERLSERTFGCGAHPELLDRRSGGKLRCPTTEPIRASVGRTIQKSERSVGGLYTTCTNVHFFGGGRGWF